MTSLPTGLTPCRTKPIVKWPGGKSSLLKHLLPLVPRDARCYCEVFGGGAALLLAREKQPAQAEVYNDANGELVNAFRQAQHHPAALIAELEFYPNSRAEMQRSLAAPEPTELKRAARFLHNNLISFGGDGKSFGVKKSPGSGSTSSRMFLQGKIEVFARRFSAVAVECLDWRRCLALYDEPTTFFFLDPPYCGGVQNAYASWTEADFRELAGVLASLRGRWLLTTSDSPAMREIFAGRTLLPVHRAKGIAAANKNKDRYAELIITP